MEGGLVHFFRHMVIGGADHHFDAGLIQPVDHIVLFQLVAGRDCNGSQLVQCENSKPELIMPLQNQHDPVTLADSQRFEVVCCLGRCILQILKGKAALGLVGGDVKHSQFVRLLSAQPINHIVSEVKVFRIPELDSGQAALGILLRDDVIVPDTGLSGFPDGCGIEVPDSTVNQLVHRFGVGIQHKGVKFAVLLLHSDHSVGDGGIVVNAVTGVEDFNVVSHLNLQSTLQNHIAFLTFVAGQFDICVLNHGVIFRKHEQGLCNPVHKGGSHVVVGHAVSLLDDLPLPSPGQGVLSQAGRCTFNNIGNIHTQSQSAAVQEREV